MPIPQEEPEILGSAIARFLVPEKLASILSITTVPAETIKDRSSSLGDLASELTGCPVSNVIDSSQYQKTISALRSDFFWDVLIQSYPRGPFMYDVIHEVRQRLIPRFHDKPSQIGPNEFARDSLVRELSPDISWSLPQPIWPFRWPHDEETLLKALSGSEVSVDAFLAASPIAFASLFPPERVKAVMPSVYRYDVPYGQSPKANSATLEALLKSARTIAVAPLLAGSTGAATAIAGGNYLIALECALAGAGATLVFIGTIAVAQLVIAKLPTQRGRRRT